MVASFVGSEVVVLEMVDLVVGGLEAVGSEVFDSVGLTAGMHNGLWLAFVL